jgi:putative aldouronate transport system permease protein
LDGRLPFLLSIPEMISRWKGVVIFLMNGTKKTTYNKILVADFKRNRTLYLMAVPVLAYYIIFHYVPIYGASIAFKDFSPGKGIWGSPWIGFEHFRGFFDSYYFWKILRNTILLNVFQLIWAFPAPIVFALLINEIRNIVFKKTVQTVTYMPHFISTVVICGLIKDFCATDGLISNILALFGIEPSNLLIRPELFRTIYISSDLWKNLGWGSIIYLVALAGISQELYEAAIIEGAGRWKQTLHITIPGISPTIIILLILRIGQMMTVGFEKIILLYNPLTYETADVISSFVYRKGIIDINYSYASAVGLFNSAVNFMLLILANRISKRFSETHLW